MKKTIGVALGLVLMIVAIMPASAQQAVTTSAIVGGNGPGAPRMVALFMTPDDNGVAADGTQVLPEPAVPNGSIPLFPNNSVDSAANRTMDGWKRINLYVMAADEAVPFKSSIAGIDISVLYPDGAEKFNLTATKTNEVWTASSNGYAPDFYPIVASELPNSPTRATPPAWTVRELTPASPGVTDLVDTNADGYVPNDSDARLYTFLGNWGSRVAYENGYNAVIAGADFNANKLLVIELVGWIWYHQDPVDYTVEAVAYGSGGTANPNISNHFEFVATTSLYLDFSQVNYGNLPAVNINKAVAGDNDLSTYGRPTVWNNGNTDAQLSVSATPMVLNGNASLAVVGGPDYNPAKIMTSFDIALDYKNDDGTVIQWGQMFFSAGDPPVLIIDSTGTPVVLKSCHPSQIDFSIHSSNAFNVAGTYSGTVTLMIEPYIAPGLPDI